MDNELRQQAVLVFDTYNEKVGEIYDDILEHVANEQTLASPEFQDYLHNSVSNSLQPWFAAELEGLAAGTPEAFIDALLNLDDVMDVFEIAAAKIDGDLPDNLMLRVGAFGDESISRLQQMALSHDWMPEEGEDEDTFRDGLAADLAALRVLGQWNAETAVQPVLAKFCALSSPDEFIADGVKSFIVPFGEKIIPELLARLNDPKDTGYKGAYEYLLICLTEIGRDNRTEEIFQCLKRVFRGMEHKVIASICLGDYGDGRAVTLLKSYIDRHMHEIDRQFFYETLSSIKRLGGDIKDIQDPFRDFKNKK